MSLWILHLHERAGNFFFHFQFISFLGATMVPPPRHRGRLRRRREHCLGRPTAKVSVWFDGRQWYALDICIAQPAVIEDNEAQRVGRESDARPPPFALESEGRNGTIRRRRRSLNDAPMKEFCVAPQVVVRCPPSCLRRRDRWAPPLACASVNLRSPRTQSNNRTQ